MTKILGAIFLAATITSAAGSSLLAATAYQSSVEGQFQKWIMTLRPVAKSRGISSKTFNSAFKGVHLDWNLPELVPPGQKRKKKRKTRQTEFGSPGRYFRPSHIDALVARGKAMRKKWQKTLKRVEARYGVPQNIILSIWGRETGYGRARIAHDTVRALATLGFMGRRKDFFKSELLDALTILEQDHIARKDFKSSWAGAMGQTQMLPSSFLKYAVDFDGDGQRNIWTSMPDALATTANFLKKQGWNNQISWGYEITLPATLACSAEGPHQARTISDWRALGIKRTRSRKFSARLKQKKASLLLPAGIYGPGFLVTSNFYVLKKYNESDLYALFVGHVADRISVDRRFDGKWRKVPTYTRDKIKALQIVFRKQGYNIGEKIDGLIGFRSRVAIGLYQRKNRLRTDCWPGPKLFRHALR